MSPVDRKSYGMKRQRPLRNIIKLLKYHILSS